MSDTTENKNEFAELLEERRKQVEELQLKQRFAEQVATEKANEKFSEMALSWEANVLDSNSDMDAQRTTLKKYKGKATEVGVGGSFVTIGAGAFKNSGIERITIGKRVGAVGKDAFLGCGKLTFVGIKDLAAWCKIKFANEYSNPLHCAHKLNLNGLNIKELVIPEYELPRIEDSRHFGGIIGNVEIPDSVEEIGDYAFFGWDSVKHVSIPKNVKKIGRAAFGKCKGIESINVSSKNEHFYVKNNCLIQKQTQELVFACARSEIPWEEVPAQIGAYTFGDWESLTNVTIPDSVESIGYGAFDGCTNLTRVTMPKRLKKQIKDAFIKERKHIKFTFTD